MSFLEQAAQEMITEEALCEKERSKKAQEERWARDRAYRDKLIAIRAAEEEARKAFYLLQEMKKTKKRDDTVQFIKKYDDVIMFAIFLVAVGTTVLISYL